MRQSIASDFLLLRNGTGAGSQKWPAALKLAALR
jgi:hypothetical protein